MELLYNPMIKIKSTAMTIKMSQTFNLKQLIT